MEAGRIHRILEISRQWRHPSHERTRDGVIKAQLVCVQGLAGHCVKWLTPVERIANEWIASGCQMNPNLVRPPRV